MQLTVFSAGHISDIFRGCRGSTALHQRGCLLSPMPDFLYVCMEYSVLLLLFPLMFPSWFYFCSSFKWLLFFLLLLPFLLLLVLPLLLLFLQFVLLIWINCFDSYLALFSFCAPSFSTPSTSIALSTAFTPSSTYFTTYSTLYSSPFVTPFALSLVAVLLLACLFYSFSYHSSEAAVAPFLISVSFPLPSSTPPILLHVLLFPSVYPSVLSIAFSSTSSRFTSPARQTSCPISLLICCCCYLFLPPPTPCNTSRVNTKHI